MKKLLLLFLTVVGFVGTANATEYSIGANEGSWKIIDQMTANGDGTYSYIINFPKDYDNYLFTIFEGTTISGDWSNAYRPSGSDANWGLDANNTPTMVKGANDFVLTYPVSSTIARAIKVDFNPSNGACTVTRLIAVGSGYNHWSLETDYLAETSRGSNVYTGRVPLEVSTDGYDDGFQFVGISSKDFKYYSYKKDGSGDEWIDVNQGNATVPYDGIYNLTAKFSNYEWVAPELVELKVSTIGTYGMATLCFGSALDFTDFSANNSDIRAYTITAHTKATGELTKNQITGKVPANTGLYIEGTSAYVPVTTYTESIDDNMLVGVTANTHIDQTADIYTNYILTVKKANGDVVAEPKFFKVNGTDGNTVLANRAYLQIPTTLATREMLWFGGDEATSVNDVKVKTNTVKGEVYDLQGRRVANPMKGLYIVNGKKVIF